uniref:Uncharacterized protein n=1 Tax=Rhizophora mucronata TaxID=61149 RepID=A0A2P2PD61_RHIMU
MKNKLSCKIRDEKRKLGSKENKMNKTKKEEMEKRAEKKFQDRKMEAMNSIH